MKSPIRPDLLIAYLAAASVVAHVLEAALPGPGPWFKLGLANIFTLVAFFHIGWRGAALVSLIRVLAGSLALGTFLSPTFFLSFSGAIAAVSVLGIASFVPVKIGPVGLSILASLAHMSSQVLVAWWLIVGHDGLFLILPWFLIGAWISGLLTGLLAYLILTRIEKHHPLEARW
ncbi:MAG: Gx transporter family protein [Magnetococcales bacterium]|nr:Gx transporter family protein [Magnetococcales bacterium]